MPPAKKAEATIKIVCAVEAPGAKLTTTAGVVSRTEPLEVPKEEAESYIARGIARVWVEKVDAAQG